ncbi:MAG: SMI1/KNR4 family protein, partial [Chryseobacterium sp.]
MSCKILVYLTVKQNIMTNKELKNIWSVPKYLPYIQAPLTDKIIHSAEDKLSVKLPKTYIELLKIQNGGYINYGLPDIQHSQIYGIGENFPSILDDIWGEVKSEEIVSFELQNLIPFDSDGHCFLCFDYRINTVEPQITYVDVDEDTSKVIAENFDKYLDLLEFESYEYIIENGFSMEENVAIIEQKLDIKFEEPDSCSHGYPIYKSEYEGDWIWISANKVPGGFVRKEDKRYDELKSQIGNSSARFLEISIDTVFIAVYNEAILRKLAENGIQT